MLCAECNEATFPEVNPSPATCVKSINDSGRTESHEVTDENGITPSAPDINLLSQGTQENLLSSQDLFEKLSITMDHVAFSALFSDNLKQVYEYDQTEITELLRDGAQSREKLGVLRLALYEKLVSLFPEYVSSQMYNRKKIKFLAEDIYILGYVIVNKSKDKRLSKVLKQANVAAEETNAANDDTLTTPPLLDSGDVIETCLVLRDSVTDLTAVIRSLRDEVRTLQDKVSQLEWHLQTSNKEEQTTASESMTGQSSSSASENNLLAVTDVVANDGDNVQKSTGSESQSANDDEVHLQVNNILVPNNNLEIPRVQPTSALSGETSLNDPSALTEVSDPTSAATEDEFRLPNHYRKQLRRGKNQQTNGKQPIKGSSNSHRIKAASKGGTAHQVRAVYIGQLTDKTSVQDMRTHLQEIGVGHVSDVIQLSCRTEGQSSFCVCVDNSIDEDKMYQAGNWPLGVRVRPYKAQPLRVASVATKPQAHHQGKEYYSRSETNHQRNLGYRRTGQDLDGSQHQAGMNRSRFNRSYDYNGSRQDYSGSRHNYWRQWY